MTVISGYGDQTDLNERHILLLQFIMFICKNTSRFPSWGFIHKSICDHINCFFLDAAINQPYRNLTNSYFCHIHVIHFIPV
jgi:hypothetical protein